MAARLLIVVWALQLGLASNLILAQTNQQSRELREIRKQAAQLDKQAAQDQDIVFNSLSQQLNIPVDTLRSQKTSTKLGFGELLIANSIANASGKSFDEIAAAFQSGRGWGEIARDYNLSLGKLVSDLKRANKRIQEARTEKIQARERNQSSSPSGQDATRGRGGPSNARGTPGGGRGKR